MTSSRDRRRLARASSRVPALRRLIVLGACLGILVLAVAAFFTVRAPSPGASDAKASLERAIAFLDAGNASAAQGQASAAVRARPDWGLAHAILAQAQLANAEGIAAEAELHRAVEAGYDARAVPHLMAQALLLQGQPERALAAAGKTDSRFRLAGLRMRARALTALGKRDEAEAVLAEAVRIAPGDAALWTDIGRFQFTTGNLAAAIPASERAVALARGRRVDSLVLRGEMVRNQFGLVAAIPWFEAALKTDPWNHDALIEYAATLGDTGRTREMLAATRRALEVRPESSQAFYLQSVLAARAGAYDLARRLLNRTGDQLQGMPGALLLGGTLDLEAGDTEQAIGKLRALTGFQPLNLDARRLLASALLRRGAARDALATVSPMIARPDADSYTLLIAARAFEAIGDRASAAQMLDRAADPVRGTLDAFSADDSLAVLAAPAQESPADPGQVMPYVRALIDSGDLNAALARARALAAANPGAPAAHVMLGDVLALMKRDGEGVAAYRRAAAIRFDQNTALRLASAYQRAGQPREASNTLALYLSQNPINAAALRLAAQWQLAAGEFDAAIQTLEGLRARLGDGDAALNAELALAYAGAGEKDAAAASGEAGYRLAPANPGAAGAFGWALYQSGEIERARALLEKAVALAPRHSTLRWQLAQVQIDLGRDGDARSNLKAALADPGFTARAEAQDLLRQLG